MYFIFVVHFLRYFSDIMTFTREIEIYEKILTIL